jgi:heme/copper-type cytochrome/quinol oxidase subunit 2
MRGALTVHEAADFTSWQQQQQVAAVNRGAGDVAASPAPAASEAATMAVAGGEAAHHSH